MNNNERPVDDNSTVSILNNETTSPVERKSLKREKRVVLLFVSLPSLVCWRGSQLH